MIYFVEDDDNIRKLVCYALAKEGYEIQGFERPSEFWSEMSRQTPELILLDIMLPEEDGLSILKKLRSSPGTEDISVIMISAKGSEYDKVAGLDGGADDYVAKPFGMTELVSRVRAVLRRRGRSKNDESKSYRTGSLYVDPSRHIIEVSGQTVALSFKEYTLLLVLLEAEGKVVRREELLNRVWGECYDESRTLDVHIRKLRVKLGAAGELIQTVKNMGYKIGSSEQ
ncbi:MAG: response regulator transcription factor [Clostridia bacterium]|nr:response regulator transcription factor [Clostridia bacterium]